MASATLGAVYSADDGWSANTGTKTTAVAAPDDADTTYVTGTGTATITYTFSEPALPDGALISNVTVTARMRTVFSPDTITWLAGDDINGESATSNPNLTTSYADYTLSMNSPPAAGGSWGDATLSTLYTSVISPDATAMRITTITATVTYTVPTSGAGIRGGVLILAPKVVG